MRLLLFATTFLLLCAPPVPAQHKASAAGAKRLLEIRSYNLKPGTRDRFHQLFLREAFPMLLRWKIDVVAYGPSLHDADSYLLMRAFRSIEDRQRVEDAFYGSTEWREGPRDAVLSLIVSYTTVVIAVEESTLIGLRKTTGAQPPPGLRGAGVDDRHAARLIAGTRPAIASVKMP